MWCGKLEKEAAIQGHQRCFSGEEAKEFSEWWEWHSPGRQGGRVFWERQSQQEKRCGKNVQCILRYIRQPAWLRHCASPGDAAKGLGGGSFLLNLVRALLKAFASCSSHEFDNQQFLCLSLKKKYEKVSSPSLLEFYSRSYFVCFKWWSLLAPHGNISLLEHLQESTEASIKWGNCKLRQGNYRAAQVKQGG